MRRRKQTRAIIPGGSAQAGSLGTESSKTLRWREMDSNYRFRATFGGVF